MTYNLCLNQGIKLVWPKQGGLRKSDLGVSPVSEHPATELNTNGPPEYQHDGYAAIPPGDSLDHFLLHLDAELQQQQPRTASNCQEFTGHQQQSTACTDSSDLESVSVGNASPTTPAQSETNSGYRHQPEPSMPSLNLSASIQMPSASEEMSLMPQSHTALALYGGNIPCHHSSSRSPPHHRRRHRSPSHHYSSRSPPHHRRRYRSPSHLYSSRAPPHHRRGHRSPSPHYSSRSPPHHSRRHRSPSHHSSSRSPPHHRRRYRSPSHLYSSRSPPYHRRRYRSPSHLYSSRSPPHHRRRHRSPSHHSSSRSPLHHRRRHRSTTLTHYNPVHIEPGDEAMEVELEQVTHEYKLLSKCSKQGRDQLVSSLGYSYTANKERTCADGSISIYWICSKRQCKAKVRQKGSIYTGSGLHSCIATSNIEEKKTLIRQVKDVAKQKPFDSAAKVVDTHLQPLVTNGVRGVKRANVVRLANKAREKGRPSHPKEKDFEFMHQAVPDGFIQADIQANGERSIILATPGQLQLLAVAKTWYVDATFKAVKKPFQQLFSLHAFVTQGNAMKQVPLLYVLMTRRRRTDYMEVFQKVKQLLPSCVVKYAMADFELATWNALRSTFPGIKVTGCHFHYCQAIFRNTQNYGLTRWYREKKEVNMIVKMLFALALLPEEHVQPAYKYICQRAERIGEEAIELIGLLEYFNRFWMGTTVTAWSPADWTVFGLTIRTNNDLEGWHRRLNSLLPHNHPNMYLLINILSAETKNTDYHIALIIDEQNIRAQTLATRHRHRDLLTLWDKLTSKEVSVSGFLKYATKLVPSFDRS